MTTRAPRAKNPPEAGYPSFEFLRVRLGPFETATHWPAARSVNLFAPNHGIDVRPVCECGWESKKILKGKDSIERAIRYAWEMHIEPSISVGPVSQTGGEP